MKTSTASPKPVRRSPKFFGQGLVEFALVLPILLALIFAILEIARLLYAWLAVQNAARFAVRYAVTGNFDKKYCPAATVFYRTHNFTGTVVTTDSLAMGAVLTVGMDTAINPYDTATGPDEADDCNIPMGVPDYALKTQLLQDWARLASIRDVAQAGAPAISASFNDANISGDYVSYLSNPFSAWSSLYRGNPGASGYFNVFICSTRAQPSVGIEFSADTPRYYPGYNGNDKYRYPDTCTTFNDATGFRMYRDDPGGPGDRVRVLVTFRHPLITPFLGANWNNVRLTAVREGIVEAYLKSRQLALPAAFGSGRTATPTATITRTPTNTGSPTPTGSPTHTPTPTQTALPCANTHDILREYWDNLAYGDLSALTSDARYPDQPDGSEFPTSIDAPWDYGGYDLFGERWRGYVCVDAPATVNFYIASDDASELYFNPNGTYTPNYTEGGGASRIAYLYGWTNHNNFTANSSQRSGTYTLEPGKHYYIEARHAQGGGGYNLSVGWNLSGSIEVIDAPYISRFVPTYPTRTPTATATPTTNCATFGNSISAVPVMDTFNSGSNQIRRVRWTVTSTNPGGQRIAGVRLQWFTFDYLTGLTESPADRVASFVYNGTALAGGSYSGRGGPTTDWVTGSPSAVVQGSASFEARFTNVVGTAQWSAMTALGLAPENFGITIAYQNGCMVSTTAVSDATFTPTVTPTRTQTPTRTLTPTRTSSPTVVPTMACRDIPNLVSVYTTDADGLVQGTNKFGCPAGCIRSPYLGISPKGTGAGIQPGYYYWWVETVQQNCPNGTHLPTGHAPGGALLVKYGMVYVATPVPPGVELQMPDTLNVPLGPFNQVDGWMIAPNGPYACYFEGGNGAEFKVMLSAQTWDPTQGPQCPINSNANSNFVVQGYEPSPTPSNTPTFTSTSTRTRTATATRTQTATATHTLPPSQTYTPTLTRTRTPTASVTPTPNWCAYRGDSGCYIVTGGCAMPAQPPPTPCP